MGLTPEPLLYDQRLDHLVYAVPDLHAGIARMTRATGLDPIPGGQHPAWGTANALLSLGPMCYLEVIGPDPHQPDPGQPRPFGIDTLTAPRLAGWAIKAHDLETEVPRIQRRAFDPGRILSGQRSRPDGSLLRWQLCLPPAGRLYYDGLVPFLIDWQDSPHPALSTPGGCTLLSLRAEHPEPAYPMAALYALDVSLELIRGPVPRLRAVLDTPNGMLELS